MKMIHKRIPAFLVYKELTEAGYAIPKEDPTEENRERWKQAFEVERKKIDIENILTIPLLTIWTTLSCTLCCKYCGNYMPLLKKSKIKYKYPFELFQQDLDLFLCAVDEVREIVFAGGGESLLTPNLEKFIDYACSQQKIRFVTITTNGSVMPNSDLCKLLNRNKEKCRVNIGNYHAANLPRYDIKRKKVIEKYMKISPDIVYYSQPHWIQTSPIKINHRTKEELTIYYNRCLHLHAPYFTSIWNGEFFTCPRHGIMKMLGYAIDNNDYIDLKKYENKTSKEARTCYNALREDLLAFYSKDFYHSCNYCNNVEDGQKPLIRSGEQC